LVRDQNGKPLRSSAEVANGQPFLVEFADGLVGATADGGAGTRPMRRRAAKARDDAEPSLFE
jgi:hypothetical protein